MERISDTLTAAGILRQLSSDWQVEVYDTVPSTNTLLRQRAEAGEKEYSAIFSGTQTGGRGRRGHTFFSPAESGLYGSVLVYPSAQQMPHLTTMAAVAVCRALEDCGAKNAQIKWVNDIFINGKKVCGILTEGALLSGSDTASFAVVGFGINTYVPSGGFPAEIAQTAGAAFAVPQTGLREKLAAKVLTQFRQIYTDGTNAFLEEYRARSLALGKWVQVLLPQGPTPAFVTGMDDDCHLLVRYADGKTGVLSSGEISIRLSIQKEGTLFCKSAKTV